ncbi:unnamed protein product [Closterium sp. Naga37s-1]|nr:unnamed protein product [Closterium sp. Naga37s-1]
MPQPIGLSMHTQLHFVSPRHPLSQSTPRLRSWTASHIISSLHGFAAGSVQRCPAAVAGEGGGGRCRGGGTRPRRPLQARGEAAAAAAAGLQGRGDAAAAAAAGEAGGGRGGRGRAAGEVGGGRGGRGRGGGRRPRRPRQGRREATAAAGEG